MATVKVKFRASTIPAKEGIVFYQVIHNRVARQIHSGHKLYPPEWDTTNAEVVFPLDTGSDRRNYLVFLKDALAEDGTIAFHQMGTTDAGDSRQV